MDILAEIEDYINTYNISHSSDFMIDTLRVEFSKQHKLDKLKRVGKWHKLKKNSHILHKLKKRLAKDEVTSAYQLESYNIYFYNKSVDKPKYRRAELVIFGLSQYHKEPPPRSLISELLTILKSASSVDICYDMHSKPDYEALSLHYELTPYISKDGVITDTRYINEIYEPLIETICIYNKSYKNNLNFEVWRIEAKVLVYNPKSLYLPLDELKTIIDKAYKCDTKM